MDTTQQIRTAFETVEMKAHEIRLVQALLDHPGSTSEQLTAVMKWKGLAWQMHFGTMCRNRKALLPEAEWVPTRNGYFYSGILADFADAGSRFTMKPAAVAAFASLGIVRRKA